MATPWRLEQARAHFSELVDKAIEGETQLVTRHGHPAVYIIAAKHQTKTGEKTLLDVLQLAPKIEEDWLERDKRPAREIDF